MVTMTITLIIVAFYVFMIPERRVLEPHLLLGLPGVNKLIPLWYGIFGLAVAIIVHEFSHGILARLADIKVKSLGLVFFVVPMGAFVEPDEEDIKNTEKKNRIRMFAVGPASNLIVAGICALIFSGLLMGSVNPAYEGVGITNVTDEIVIESQNFTMNTSAHNASLLPGMIIIRLNDTDIYDKGDLNRALNDTRAGQNITLAYYYREQVNETTVTLTNKDYYYWQVYGDEWKGHLNITYDGQGELYYGKGFLGIESITVTTADYHPFMKQEGQSTLESVVIYITLPLTQKSPITDTTSQFYEVSGIMGSLPDSVFWVLSNGFYWLFWLNLMVGLTNALPAVPLDGGYIYRDWLDSIFKKLRPGQEEKKRDKVVDTITISTAFFILFLILWQIIGPRIL